MNQEESKSIQRLIQAGICNQAEVEESRKDAAAFSSPEFSRKIRRAGDVLGAMGEPNRIKILLLLSKKEMCVCHLESALGMSQPTISHHLGVLERAGLLHRRKKEKWVFYKLTDSPVTDLLRSLVL